MSLPLPNERESVLPAAVAVAAAVVLAALGCGGVSRPRTIQATSFRPARMGEPANLAIARAATQLLVEARAARRIPDSGELVAQVLNDSGVRFGTDGSVAATLAFLRGAQMTIAASDILPGDVVFFDLDAPPRAGCRGRPHAGIVESVDGGRIAFIESRDGRVRRSFLHTRRVLARRDEEGRILNTFLRPMRVGDPAGTRYFAGDMLCAVARVRR